MKKYRVSITERVSSDWMFEDEASSEEEARLIASECYTEKGIKERERDGEFSIDWVDEVQP